MTISPSRFTSRRYWRGFEPSADAGSGPQLQVLQAGNLSMDSAARQVSVDGDAKPPRAASTSCSSSSSVTLPRSSARSRSTTRVAG